MGKITIKHFLNTNLKPYVINKTNYYSIYLLITAERKTTKIKSSVFNEYYSENDFEEIFNSDNEKDKTLIENEINAIKIITELVIDELQEFDTNFMTAFYNFSNTIDIWHIDNEIFSFNDRISLFDSKNNNAGISIDSLKSEISSFKLITLFEFFNKVNQEKSIEIFTKQNVKNPEDVLRDVNKSFFYCSLELFETYIKGNKKRLELLSKFRNFFLDSKNRFDYYIVNKYKIN